MTVYRKLERYWRRSPIWLPFLLLLVFTVSLVTRHPGLRDALFGTRIDAAHPRTVRGIFDKHVSTFEPYELHSASGLTVRVSCKAHERFALCLDGKPVFGRTVDVTYLPASGALLKGSQGIVSTISEEGSIVAANDPANLVPNPPATAVVLFLKAIIGFCALLLALIALFLLIGVVTSVRRLFGGEGYSDPADLCGG